MNQFEGQRNNQQINQIKTKLTLQRSVSPFCKLIIFNNLDSNEKVSKSMRAKDDTSILDVLLYLEQQHKNQCIITLYHNKNPINIDKNTYLLPFLQKLKVQQLDYKAISNKLFSSDIEEDDENPGLDKKLSEKDSSTWLINKKGRYQSDNQQGGRNEVNKAQNQQSGPIKNDLFQQQYSKSDNLQGERNEVNKAQNQQSDFIKNDIFQQQYSKSDNQQGGRNEVNKTQNQQSNSIKNDLLQQQYSKSGYGNISQNNSSTEMFEKREEQKNSKSVNYYNPNLNQSELSIISILCKCQRSYNSQELQLILKNAIYNNQIATCEKCNKKIPRSMYSKIKVLEQQYHNCLLLLELEILKNQLIHNYDIQKCSNCNFFCIWNKNIQINRGFCPNCIQDKIIYKKQ